jgi:hypothetical protein
MIIFLVYREVSMSIDPTQAQKEEELKYQTIGNEEGRLNSKKVIVVVTEYGGYGRCQLCL